MTDVIWVALIGALGVTFGAVLSSSLQIYKWRTGEQTATGAKTLETYANTTQTSAETNLKLLEQILTLQDSFEKSLTRIDLLENTRGQLESRVEQIEKEKLELQTRVKELEDTRGQLEMRVEQLEAEKADLQTRVKELEQENARLLRNRRRNGLATE